jgi:hypothetical protein
MPDSQSLLCKPDIFGPETSEVLYCHLVVFLVCYNQVYAHRAFHLVYGVSSVACHLAIDDDPIDARCPISCLSTRHTCPQTAEVYSCHLVAHLMHCILSVCIKCYLRHYSAFSVLSAAVALAISDELIDARWPISCMPAQHICPKSSRSLQLTSNYPPGALLHSACTPAAGFIGGSLSVLLLSPCTNQTPPYCTHPI